MTESAVAAAASSRNVTIRERKTIKANVSLASSQSLRVSFMRISRAQCRFRGVDTRNPLYQLNMKHCALSYCLLFAIAVSVCDAWPQQRFSPQDGFFFPGDADRPINFTLLPTPSTTTTTTAGPPNTREYNDCVNQCPSTGEYNPVCGTDNVVYSNPGRLGCARNCGRNIDVKRYGQCMDAIRG